MAPSWWPLAALAGGLVLVVLLAPAGALYSLLHPPQVGGQTTPSDLGLDHEHRRLTTTDGVELDAWIVPAANDTDSAIVVAHGYPASKADVLPLAAPLADDHHLVLVDHRGLGNSTGQTTVGIREPLDVDAGIQAAADIDNVTTIGLLGFSMGGAASLQAGDDPRVDAIVTQAAYSDLESLASANFRGLGPLAGPMGSLLVTYAGWQGLEADQARPVDDIRELDIPVFLIHARDDSTIPLEHGQRLAEAGPTAKLWVVDRSAHGTAHLHPDWEPRVRGFFHEHLG